MFKVILHLPLSHQRALMLKGPGIIAGDKKKQSGADSKEAVGKQLTFELEIAPLVRCLRPQLLSDAHRKPRSARRTRSGAQRRTNVER